MSSDAADQIATYEISAQSLRGPWVARSLRHLMAHQRQLPGRRYGAAVIGILVSVGLHMALISSMIMGGAHAKPASRPQQQGEGAIALSAGEEPRMTLIFIDAASISKRTADEALASNGLQRSDLPIRIVSLDNLPAFDFPDIKEALNASDAEQIEDPTHHALMVGRYTNQIKARIERAWMRPRTRIGSVSFDCTVQIVQDGSGYVSQTTLQYCNGSSDWQLSLVRAIESASPLPAPPEASVFANAVTLQFESQAFVGSESAEGFEPARAASLTVARRAPADARAANCTQCTEALPAAPPSRSLKLTIEGSRVVYEPAAETTAPIKRQPLASTR